MVMMLDPSQMTNPGEPDLSLLGNRAPKFGFGQNLRNAVGPLLGNQDFALSLLSNSGYSPQKRSLGEIFGTSALQAQQMGQQRQDNAFRQQLQMMQLQSLKRQQSLYGAIQPDKFTPESLAQFEKTQQYSDLKLRPIGMQTGRYNPGDFTPESWASFLSSNDPAQLVRYVTPQNATVEKVAGGYEAIQPDKTGKMPPRRTVLTTPQQEREAASLAAAATASGEAQGAAAGGQAAKAPAKASMDYVIGQFRDQLKTTPQGGLFGYKGTSGKVFSKADKERFDNLREQLSTELRTAFRIPGEGTLSDAEQKQYGVQLPSTDYEPENNAKILTDLETRTGLRLNTPVDGDAPRRRKYNPATGKIE